MILISINELSNYNGNQIINIEELNIYNVLVGDLMIISKLNSKFKSFVINSKEKLYFYTGFKEFIILTDKNKYKISINKKKQTVFIGEKCKDSIIKEKFNLEIDKELKGCEIINTINARCEKSMYLLDDIHRKYISNISFDKHSIIGIIISPFFIHSKGEER